MKLPFFVFVVALGVIVALHLAMNARVGEIMENPRVANAIFWTIGGVMAILVGLTGWESGALGNLKMVHPLLLTAGALGACLVFAIAWSIPKVGAGNFFIVLLAGQVIGGLVMSHFGWLSTHEPISLMQLGGAVLMVVGAAIATMAG